MRLRFLDNIRWVVVLLVLVFHVFYYYSACCPSGTGIGGFSSTQPQDAVVYFLYPWMMPLLFLVAGISSRYALQHRTAREYLRSRTLKLLIPALLGPLFFQWIAGWFGMLTLNYRLGTDMAAGQPLWIVAIIVIISGGGGLWFIKLLWLFSMLTPLISRIGNLFASRSLFASSRRQAWWVAAGTLVGGCLLWLADQTVLDVHSLQSPAALYNLYRPLYYFTAYLLGYFFFARKRVQYCLMQWRWVTVPLALLCGIWLTVTTFGQDPYSPAYIRSWGNNLYAWLMIIAVFGGFKAWADSTNRFATYCTENSYGIYILQFAVQLSIGYLLRAHTALPAWSMYLILMMAMFTVTPALNELFRRIPVVRLCVLGYLPPKKPVQPQNLPSPKNIQPLTSPSPANVQPQNNTPSI